MSESITILNIGDDDIELTDLATNQSRDIAPNSTFTLPITFASDPSQIAEWKIELKQDGSCQFHQTTLLGTDGPNKGTLLLEASELSGGSHLAVKVHGRPRRRRQGTETPIRAGKRKVTVTRSGSGRIKSAHYLRASTAIEIKK